MIPAHDTSIWPKSKGVLPRLEGRFDDPPPLAQVSAHQLIALVLEQNNSRDVAALTAVVLENLPKDYGGIRLALQQLVASEIRRRLLDQDAPRLAPTVPAAERDEGDEDSGDEGEPLIAEPATEDFGPAKDRRAVYRGGSQKWQDTAAAANDPLKARVLVAGIWRTWAALTAEDLRAMARADERRATRLLERVVKLEALAADMDAAGVSRLASLPDAGARIEGL